MSTRETNDGPSSARVEWDAADLFGRARVMVVDDNSTNVVLLDRILSGAGVGEVLGLSDARMVVEQCGSWRPDLILLDLHMPHMDGIDVLRALRESPATSAGFLPVLMLTADATPRSKAAGLAAGAQDFVTKPFDRTEVLLRVRNLLETRFLYVRLREHHALETAMALTNDRERIARDLHDTVIQRLFAEGLGLQASLRIVDAPMGDRLRRTIDSIDQSIKDLRMAVFTLQGSVAAPSGIRGRILEIVRDSAHVLGFEPRLQFAGSIETMAGATAEELMHVLRESLSNVAQHAHARRARVAVDVTGQAVLLTVADDGVGVPAEVFGGRGLMNMKARAEALGGTSAVVNGDDGGTVLTWQVPASHARADRYAERS